MNIPLPLMPIRALTIQGSYVGNVKELRELVKIAQSGALPAIPITNMPQDQADAALNRLKDGKVVGRIVLTAAAA
jgi:alcohol dehydrogenase/propanol-preferring alcohol dehydrogenase